jgi:glycerol-3-phosphate dehydrogenase
MSNTTPSRPALLARLRSQPAPDVLIIGGGINGIGTYRDLALQGVDALLAERGDYCSGASGASSHMVHGGIRYLENGEFRLVREAVAERNRLLRNAPHLVHPLPTVIPIFRRFSGTLNAPFKFLRLRSRPAERGALIIKLGLLLYDAYTRDRAVPRHRFFNRRQALAQFPQLNPGVIAAARYYDALMPSPERICMDLLADVRRDNPQATALNYMKVNGLQANGVREGRVTLRDGLSGEEFTLAPKVIINAAGAWIDRVNALLGAPSCFIGGTKGSHLVLDHPGLRQAIAGHEFFFENTDGRIVLICPLHDKILLGTSDLPIQNPDEAECTEAEIDYFFQMVGRIFPGIQLSRQHITHRFSGVRPLPASAAKSAGQISRDHQIIETPPDAARPFPILSLVGGKWTTFRAFSAQAADRALAILGKARRVSTAGLPIGGGRDFPRAPAARAAWLDEACKQTGIARARMDVLLTRYGTRALELAALPRADDAPHPDYPGYSVGEIDWLVNEEQVAHEDDLRWRRMGWG